MKITSKRRIVLLHDRDTAGPVTVAYATLELALARLAEILRSRIGGEHDESSNAVREALDHLGAAVAMDVWNEDNRDQRYAIEHVDLVEGATP